MIRILLVLFVLSACIWAQTETSLTVTSTRSISVQPDQDVLLVTVTTPLSTAFDDVLTAVASTGITAANLSSVSSEPTTPNMMTLEWQFSLPVPLTTVKTLLNSLAALQQSIGRRAGCAAMSNGGSSRRRAGPGAKAGGSIAAAFCRPDSGVVGWNGSRQSQPCGARSCICYVSRGRL